jgi:hypothetical protein
VHDKMWGAIIGELVFRRAKRISTFVESLITRQESNWWELKGKAVSTRVSNLTPHQRQHQTQSLELPSSFPRHEDKEQHSTTIPSKYTSLLDNKPRRKESPISRNHGFYKQRSRSVARSNWGVQGGREEDDGWISQTWYVLLSSFGTSRFSPCVSCSYNVSLLASMSCRSLWILVVSLRGSASLDRAMVGSLDHV